MGKSPFDYLTEPVITDAERAAILLHMSRTAYETWCELGAITPNWDALSVTEKHRWGEAIRTGVRAMFNLAKEDRVRDQAEPSGLTPPSTHRLA